MIARTYYVVMPEGVGEAPPGDIDIVIEGYPGTQDDPIDTGNSPAGWTGDTGSYYEIRGRTVRLPVQVGDAGFVPRFNLGWSISVAAYGSGAAPAYELSASLQNSLDATPLTDPSYGPVLRLKGTTDTGGQQVVVNLLIMEAKDEDRSNNVSP